jgi:hypothetical protein
VSARTWQTASAGHGSRGELAYFSCHVPAGRACSFTTLIRVAGRRWLVEEDFALGKSWFGLADSQGRRYTAIIRHLALAMAALAVCAVTAALARERTSTLARLLLHPRTCRPTPGQGTVGPQCLTGHSVKLRVVLPKPSGLGVPGLCAEDCKNDDQRLTVLLWADVTKVPALAIGSPTSRSSLHTRP